MCTPSRATRTLAWITLTFATVAAFASVRANGFLWWDDAIYINQNAAMRAGLSQGTLAYAFTSGDAANWHPLAWLSHVLDVDLFGFAPDAHHLVSLGLHALTSVLLRMLVHRWTARFGVVWLVAALFALHPLHVESVA